MKAATTFALLALGLSAMIAAESQTTARGSADSQSNTSVSADRNGAGVSQQSRGAASAESEHASAALSEGTEFNAMLSRRVTTRNAKPGDEVTATLSEDVESNGAVVLEKGTRLAGRVTEARRRGEATASGSTESQLAIVFERAIPKRGPEIPINATIHALATAESAARAGSGFQSPLASRVARPAGHAGTSGGLIGGAGGVVGGVSGVASGAGAVGSELSGFGRSAQGTLESRTRAAGALTSRSAGASGGLNALGHLTSGSRGVFGMDGVGIASRATASAATAGSVITSAGRDVRLDSGTRLLLVTGAAARAR